MFAYAGAHIVPIDSLYFKFKKKLFSVKISDKNIAITFAATIFFVVFSFDRSNTFAVSYVSIKLLQPL